MSLFNPGLGIQALQLFPGSPRHPGLWLDASWGPLHLPAFAWDRATRAEWLRAGLSAARLYHSLAV